MRHYTEESKEDEGSKSANEAEQTITDLSDFKFGQRRAVGNSELRLHRLYAQVVTPVSLAWVETTWLKHQVYPGLKPLG